MINRKLSDLLSRNKVAVGSVVGLRDPLVAIILANAGYDWLWIDLEHNPFTETQLQMMIYSLRGRDITPVVRVRENTQGNIKIALDIGAGGVLVPQLETMDDIRKAVEYAKYPPQGKRGFGPMHATDYWNDEYAETANADIKLIIQIETVKLVEQIGSVVAIPGIDAVFIGPADLSWSMGLKGRSDHPEFEAAIELIAQACNRQGIPWGLPVGDADAFFSRYKQGARLLSVGADRGFIQSGAKQLVQTIRQGLADIQ
jgi:2-keto-3-deoxy-L-rhamnonate aldolase RhmA